MEKIRVFSGYSRFNRYIRIAGGRFWIMAWILVGLTSCCSVSERLNLAEVNHVIQTRKFVDLTHAFSPGIPHWPGFPDEKIKTLYMYDPGEGQLGSGFYAQSYTLVGQWGTHVDAPAYFVKGTRTVDQIPVK